MQNPDNLRVVQLAEDLAIAVYDFTAAFPREERYGLTAQMRDAAVSVGSNICEGCGREGNSALRPFHHSLGSLLELDFQRRIATRRTYGNERDRTDLRERILHLRRKLVMLISRMRG